MIDTTKMGFCQGLHEYFIEHPQEYSTAPPEFWRAINDLIFAIGDDGRDGEGRRRKGWLLHDVLAVRDSLQVKENTDES